MRWGQYDFFQFSEGLFQLTGSMMEEFSHELKQNSGPARLIVRINVLVIRDDHRVILCDTGIGTKHRDEACSFPTRFEKHIPLRQHLLNVGIQPEDVTHILMTHLHYDHAGGLTCYDANGELEPTFPNAQVFVQTDEWDAANQAVYKGSRGYFSENWGLLQHSPDLVLVDGDEDVLPGIQLVHTNGHTKGHQIVLIDDGEGNKAAYMGDLIPTPSHFTRGLTLKFDVDPKKSRMERDALVEQAAKDGWLLFFYHAPSIRAGKPVVSEESRVKIQKVEVQ